MVLKQEIIERIKGRGTELKLMFCDEMGGISIQAVNQALNKNRHNSWLVSKPILQIISNKLNTPEDQLVEETPKTKQPCEA